MNTSPARRLSQRWARAERCSKRPKPPENTAIAPNTSSVASMKTAPSSTICQPMGPASGRVNWGRNAKKNNSTLGLVRFMMMPRRYSAPRASGSGRCPPPPPAGARNTCQAR
ncbi:Uncharacterised protein [Bordetella pertussis]|nr:Uncharacterised protein [Bordetella pertussis]CFM66105.1 Uncharacterised protein [Bordetella pertussis]CFN40821.1 Uncharacterised protein [Bordetella pertussis]CFN78156.1 Uncharacterised protein [Bordetella pertussis]CFN99375.1 Uncharacterised protein [Bordetella pertussis]